MKLMILSGADRVRYPTSLNHKIYADRNNYRYRFDLTPSANVRNPYFHKIRKIADALIDTDWMFWIDDDAAFTQLDKRLDHIAPEIFETDVHIVFCKSPVNPQGGWTHISSGNFFIKNSEIGRRFISLVSENLLQIAKEWWDTSKYGMFTNGDQDVLVYILENNLDIKQKTRILEFDRFNTRPYHFTAPQDHFLVHFTGRADQTKLEQMQQFCSSYQLTPFFVDQHCLAPYTHYIESNLQMCGLQV